MDFALLVYFISVFYRKYFKSESTTHPNIFGLGTETMLDLGHVSLSIDPLNFLDN